MTTTSAMAKIRKKANYIREPAEDLMRRIHVAEQRLAGDGVYPSHVQVAKSIGKTKSPVADVRSRMDPYWSGRFADLAPGWVTKGISDEQDDEQPLPPGDVEVAIFQIRTAKETGKVIDFDSDCMDPNRDEGTGTAHDMIIRTVPLAIAGDRPEVWCKRSWGRLRPVRQDTDSRTPAQRVTDTMRRQRRNGSDVAWLGKVGLNDENVKEVAA